MRRQALLQIAFFVACGIAAGLIATMARRPTARSDELRVVDTEFNLERSSNDPFVVRPEKWQPFPALRGDFDLLADVELGAGAEFDLVLRRMEPFQVQGLSLPFQGRFTVLRLSTTADGAAWRTPTEALLGPPGGVRVAPGLTAGIRIEARGRRLTGNVAGKVLPEVLAQDEIGSIALIARGAPVAVQKLSLQPVPSIVTVPPWLLGAAAGLVVAACALRRRCTAAHAFAVGAVLIVGSVVVLRYALLGLPPLAQPDARDEALVALAGVPLALALLLRVRAQILWLPVAMFVAAGIAVVAQQRQAERFPATRDLDWLLGPAAGVQVVESLARTVRGPTGLHFADNKKRFVFLLGGQLLYESMTSGQEQQHMEPLLGSELRSLGADIEVASLPTVDGYATQQWRLFATCFRDFAPKVLVFGVPHDEAAIDEADGQPRSTPATVEAALIAAEGWAKANGSKVVLLADRGLDANFYAVLQRGSSRGLPMVAIEPNDTPTQVAQMLAKAITPLLQ